MYELLAWSSVVGLLVGVFWLVSRLMRLGQARDRSGARDDATPGGFYSDTAGLGGFH